MLQEKRADRGILDGSDWGKVEEDPRAKMWI